MDSAAASEQVFAKTEVWSSGNIAKDVSSRCRLVSHDAIPGFFLSGSCKSNYMVCSCSTFT